MSEPKRHTGVSRPYDAFKCVCVFWMAVFFVSGATIPAAAQDRVIINGERVTQEAFAGELGRLGFSVTTEVPDGDYWYDDVSGLWGVRGGPMLGQLPPDLNLGGKLPADASGSGSGVFMNGRELHSTEVAYLQQLFGYTIPGRYWMNAQGVGGVEGGPPIFDMVAVARSLNRAGSYTRRGLFGSMGSDGSCSYFMTPGGSSVMTGAC